MKAYILTEEDLHRLILAIDRNPAHGMEGGGSVALSEAERSSCLD